MKAFLTILLVLFSISLFSQNTIRYTSVKITDENLVMKKEYTDISISVTFITDTTIIIETNKPEIYNYIIPLTILNDEKPVKIFNRIGKIQEYNFNDKKFFGSTYNVNNYIDKFIIYTEEFYDCIYILTTKSGIIIE